MGYKSNALTQQIRCSFTDHCGGFDVFSWCCCLLYICLSIHFSITPIQAHTYTQRDWSHSQSQFRALHYCESRLVALCECELYIYILWSHIRTQPSRMYYKAHIETSRETIYHWAWRCAISLMAIFLSFGQFNAYLMKYSSHNLQYVYIEKISYDIRTELICSSHHRHHIRVIVFGWLFALVFIFPPPRRTFQNNRKYREKASKNIKKEREIVRSRIESEIWLFCVAIG